MYLLPISSYLAGPKSVSACPPVRPGYDDKYRPRSYRFVEREKLVVCIGDVQWIRTDWSFPAQKFASTSVALVPKFVGFSC